MPTLTDIRSMVLDRTASAGPPIICRAAGGGISRAHWETDFPVDKEVRFGGRFKLASGNTIWRGTFMRVEDYRPETNYMGQNRLEVDGYGSGQWWLVRNTNGGSWGDLVDFPKVAIPRDVLVDVEVRCLLRNDPSGWAELWVNGAKKGGYAGPTWYGAPNIERVRFGNVQNANSVEQTVEIHSAFVSWGTGTVVTPPPPPPPSVPTCEEELAACKTAGAAVKEQLAVANKRADDAERKIASARTVLG